ncbi:alpha/beta hydrolase [Chrysiogenes arsenatis]|uniref:alpha/beta hydrolase n=1 Tax=Chrysiogenes arsenatis TaxID=309797 RepID=UPI00040B7052|nr:alpha/beta fold hydrolase [Chrysiogenes arsenatis]
MLRYIWLPALLLVIVALWFAFGRNSNALRLQSSGVNRNFSFEATVPFADYIAASVAMIRHVREQQPHIPAEWREFSIQANAPFELRPAQGCPTGANGRYAKGILLLHGLSDSPYSMRALGEHLAQRCFLVRALLLPGHGTVPGDLREADMTQWLAALTYGVTQMDDVDELYLGGFSTGGALAVHHALQGTTKVRGLVLVAPALAINTPFTTLLPLIARVYPWLTRGADRDLVKYESFALRGAAEVQRLIETNDALMLTPGNLRHLPVFIAVSQDDPVVSTARTSRFFTEQAQHPASRMVIFEPRDNDDFDPSKRTYFLNSSLPEKGITSFSHVSLPYRPDDLHYGEQGIYREWQQGKRLTYNPRFDDMVTLLDEWLASIDAPLP